MTWNLPRRVGRPAKHSRARWRRVSVLRVAIGTIVLGVTLGMGSGPASADPFGYPNPGYYPDGTDHWYCFDASFFNNQQFVHSALQYLDATTNMYDVYTSTCGTSTDVVYINIDNGDSLGFAPCMRWVNQTTHVCDQFWNIINVDAHWRATATCGGDAAELLDNLQISIRHELGHTGGLSHQASNPGTCSPPNPAADDAMVSDWITGATLGYVDYNGHHINHINCQC